MPKKIKKGKRKISASVSNFKSLSSVRRPRCNINKINIKAGAKTKLYWVLSAGSNCLCRCNAAEVIRMSSRAGVVIFRMARYYSTDEVLEMVLDSECQDNSSSSSEDSGEKTDNSVELEQLESSSHEETSDAESEGEMEEAASEWTAKNGKIVWSPTHTETLRYFPAATNVTPGPTHYAAARIRDPASSFALLFTDEIVQHTVAMTNLHGRRPVAGWRDMDCDELHAYVGLLILAGVYRSRHESSRSLWSDKCGRDIFRATMSHKRFHQIVGALRFDDKLSRLRQDKLAAFRKVWDLWTHRLELLFNPGRDICVDEQLVPFRGRCKFKQYIPTKPARYGLKIWAVCDVETSYAWRLQVCKAGDRAEVNQGMRVALELTEGLQGNVVTCDNFFTSFALAEELLKRKVALIGTIRKNEPELPPRLLQTRGRAVLSSAFAFTLTHTLVSYVPRRGKNVLLMSTKHRTPDVSGEGKRKPVTIQDYNRCKGGVDNLDKVGVITH